MSNKPTLSQRLQHLIADFPLRRKLMLITMLIVLVATLTILLFLRYQSEQSRRDNFVQNALAQTRLVAEYVVSPLVFDDAKGAREILAKLARNPHVAYIRLFDANKALFAEVTVRDSTSSIPAMPAGQDWWIDKKLLHVAEPVKQHGTMGELRVGFRLDGLEKASGDELEFLLGMLAVVIVASYFLTLWLQKIIADPLLALASHARNMAETQDLSVRLAPPGKDEIGSLYVAFNRLIERVRSREDDILALNRSLEAKVAKRTRDLEAARDNADRANQGKSEFLANMSHEIRTPINAITGFTSLALRTQLSAKQQSYLDKTQIAAQGLLRIINDLLDFSKIEAGHLDMEHIGFDLAEVLDSTIAHVGSLAERKGLEVLIELAPDVPTRLLGDPLRLGQVLINLCSNAVKFTEQGEVEVRVERYQQQEQTLRLHFSVRDTGIGLTPEQSAKLFQAFTQADTSTTRRFGGTGLGLVICERIVSMMHGRIWLESEVGLGTTFHFIVELEVDTAPIAVKSGYLPTSLDGRIALIVDDNANARQILLAQLTGLGMRARAVESGEAALSELQRASNNGEPYPLVLMDWKMPGLDGLSATRAIRADPAISQTPVIIMVTAFGREQAMGAPDNMALLDGVLIKPVTPALLAETLSRAVAGSTDPVREQKMDPLLRTHGLAGVRLLLVEDNPVNQSLAMELLEQEGADVTIAGNGRIAIHALETLGYDHFDVILMDLQMPEMDGYEATQHIRRQAAGKDIPLLAMTAHAMLEERERCLALGMNDHISKPIDPGLMVRKIQQWIGDARLADASRRPGALGNVSTPDRDAKPTSLPDELPGVDLVAGLWRCNGDTQLLRDLLVQFAAHYADSAQHLYAAVAGQRLQDARFLAHTIKGAAANLGANALAKAAAQLNTSLERGADPALADLLAAFAAAHKILIASIATLGGQQGNSAPPSTQDDAPLSDAVRTLLPLLQKHLETNDTHAEQVLAELETEFGDTQPAWFNQVVTAIHALDYHQALVLVQALHLE